MLNEKSGQSGIFGQVPASHSLIEHWESLTMMKTPLICCLLLVGMAAASDAANPPFKPRRVLAKPLPAIVDAPVVAASKAANVVNDSELALGVVVNGQARAYPLNMLTGPKREIINDTLGGVRIAATW